MKLCRASREVLHLPMKRLLTQMVSGDIKWCDKNVKCQRQMSKCQMSKISNYVKSRCEIKWCEIKWCDTKLCEIKWCEIKLCDILCEIKLELKKNLSSAEPPSYDSLFGRIRDTHKASRNVIDFVVKVRTLRRNFPHLINLTQQQLWKKLTTSVRSSLRNHTPPLMALIR